MTRILVKSSPSPSSTARPCSSKSSSAKAPTWKGNFKALFEAIEREQETRGTLNLPMPDTRC